MGGHRPPRALGKGAPRPHEETIEERRDALIKVEREHFVRDSLTLDQFSDRVGEILRGEHDYRMTPIVDRLLIKTVMR